MAMKVKFLHHLLTMNVARVEMRRDILFVSPIMGDEWSKLCAVSHSSLMIFSFCPSCSMHSNEMVIIYQ